MGSLHFIIIVVIIVIRNVSQEDFGAQCGSSVKKEASQNNKINENKNIHQRRFAINTAVEVRVHPFVHRQGNPRQIGLNP